MKSSHVNKTLFCCAAAVLLTTVMHGFELVKDGKTAEIVLSENAHSSSKLAAQELADYTEKVTGKKAILNMKGMQKGDVVTTWADTSALEKDFGYCPKIGIEEGVERFVKWYREFYSC